MATPARPQIPADQSGPASEHVSVHRWPWTGQEIMSMGIVFACWAAFGLLAHSLIWGPVLVSAGVGSAYWLYRVKKHRVGTSQVTVTVLGTRIKVASDGPLGQSAVDVAKVIDVGYRRYMSDETFMLSDGTMTAKVPLRATSDPIVSATVQTAFNAATTVSTEARDLLDRIPDSRT